MQDVTAAYELLRDRSASDASSPHDVPAAWPPPSPSPRRTRTIVIFLALLAVMSGLVLAGSGSSAPAPDPGRDDDLSGLKGRCITLRPSGAFEDVVDCTRPHDARVIEVVDREQPCPLWADRSLAGSKQQLCLDIVFSG